MLRGHYAAKLVASDGYCVARLFRSQSHAIAWIQQDGLKDVGAEADFAEIWIDDKLVWRKSDLTDGDPVWRTEYLKLPS
jgi:hypothetical protein